MKKLLIVFLALGVLISTLPADIAYAGGEYKETVLDKAWDWMTTLGKEGVEKDKILAQNKAERLKRHAEKTAAQAKKKAGKAGKEAKGKFKKMLGD